VLSNLHRTRDTYTSHLLTPHSKPRIYRVPTSTYLR
jgi:hypothetical protein